MKNLRRAFPALALIVVLGASVARADEAAQKGRTILETHRDAVVTLQVVVNQKVSFPGMASRNNESKVEATGTVISADGLTIMSLSETDPSSIVESMMAASGQGQNLQMETEIKDVKIMLADGGEVEAEIILRDRDLDMAFVRPLKKPEAPFQFVDLSKTGQPDYLDEVITLNRLGQVANRAYAASVERIDAIVERPRRFYVPGNDPTQTGLGSPVFTLNGDFIGVFLMRVISGAQSSGLGGMFGGGRDNMMSVILPAADIAEAAAQAPPFEE